MHETAYLNPSLTIIYEDKRGAETEQVVYHEPDGILGFIRELNEKKEAVHEPVYFKGESDGIEVEAAFQYVNEFHENVLGFCNNIYNAEGGTHLTGFKTTFTTVMNQYARELGILKEKDANFTGRGHPKRHDGHHIHQAPGSAVRGADEDEAGQPGRGQGCQQGGRG